MSHILNQSSHKRTKIRLGNTRTIFDKDFLLTGQLKLEILQPMTVQQAGTAGKSVGTFGLSTIVFLFPYLISLCVQ